MSTSTAYILCIETANVITSVALAKDGICISQKTILESNKAADALQLLVGELLTECKLTFNELNAIAISSGPGSYTGLRITAASAKAYCLALKIPLIAIPTLEAMLYGVQKRYLKTTYDVFVPMIDARRMEVFTSFYNIDFEVIKSFGGLVLDVHFQEMIEPDKRYLLFGNGALKANIYSHLPNLEIFHTFEHAASDLCALAFKKLGNKQFEDIAYFEPNYTKQVYITQPS